MTINSKSSASDIYDFISKITCLYWHSGVVSLVIIWAFRDRNQKLQSGPVLFKLMYIACHVQRLETVFFQCIARQQRPTSDSKVILSRPYLPQVALSRLNPVFHQRYFSREAKFILSLYLSNLFLMVAVESSETKVKRRLAWKLTLGENRL